MKLLWPVAAFEMRLRRRQVSPYIFFLINLLLGFCFVATDMTKSMGLGSSRKLDSPLVIALLVQTMTVLGAFMVAGLMGTAVYRDFERGTHELFFTTRLSRAEYLLGRFLGSYLVTVLVFSGVLAGMLLASVMPWVSASQFHRPFTPLPYLAATVEFLLPNLFLLGALFFVAGAITRSLPMVYLCCFGLLTGYLFASALARGYDDSVVAVVLLDPLGLSTTSYVTRYWTLFELNENFLSLTGPLLMNRLLCIGGGALVLFGGLAAFRQRSRLEYRLWRPARQRSQTVDAAVPARAWQRPPADRFVPQAWRQFSRLTALSVKEIVGGVPFLTMLVLAAILLLATAGDEGKAFDTPVYPVTRVLLTHLEGFAGLFLLIIGIFYAGEVVWKERTLRLDPIQDALPLRSTTLFTARLLAVLIAQILFALVLILASMLYQLTHGISHLEPLVYGGYLLIGLTTPVVCFTILSLLIQMAANHKFTAHAIVVAVIIGYIGMNSAGWDHNLIQYGTAPSVVYSDMNGFGPFLPGVAAFSAYWLTASALLGIAAVLLQPRGAETGLRDRLRRIRAEADPRLRVVVAGLGALFVGLGIFIFYNTNILSRYHTDQGRKAGLARYEKSYRARYFLQPTVRVTAATLTLDLYPKAGSYRSRGVLDLINRTNKPITDVPLDLPYTVTVHSLELDRPATRTVSDAGLGFYVLRLTTPLPPGETMRLRFDLGRERRGFRNEGAETDVVSNGTFLSDGVLPTMRYNPGGELSDPADRRRYGLPTRPRMAPVSDTEALNRTYVGADADWMQMDAIIRTDADQTSLAPGRLVREWREGSNRRGFQFRTEAPVRNFFTFLSAKYAVRRDTWSNGKQKVNLAVYYHPSHTFNVERMLRGAKQSLAYCTENYGPYPNHELRIVEFPCYQEFAQSFSATIPYSEGMGFIARVIPPEDANEKENTDYPFFVTAHEVAHQWWAHQVIGADVEGAEMLAESLSEYTALMVTKKEYGSDRLRSFLRYDLHSYLTGRGTDTEEMPLSRCQHQSYIHYNKGSLVFHYLSEVVGEKALNQTLRGFVSDYRFAPAPYPTAGDLTARLRTLLPPQDRYLITDLFDTMTLYNNTARSAVRQKLPDGRWKVTIKADCWQARAGDSGRETTVPTRSRVEVGVFAAGDPFGKPLVVQMVPVNKTDPTIDLTFPSKDVPSVAGIDPYNRLIDRNLNDNLVTVTEAQKR